MKQKVELVGITGARCGTVSAEVFGAWCLHTSVDPLANDEICVTHVASGARVAKLHHTARRQALTLVKFLNTLDTDFRQWTDAQRREVHRRALIARGVPRDKVADLVSGELQEFAVERMKKVGRG